VQGVAQVNITGGQEEIQVNLDAVKMQGTDSIPQVQQNILSQQIFQQEIFKLREKNINSFSWKYK
jgi:multidrug efflux pump subunit AcrB